MTETGSDIKTKRSATLAVEPILSAIRSALNRSGSNSSHGSSRINSQLGSFKDGNKSACDRKSKREMSLFNNEKINEKVGGNNFLAVEFGESDSPVSDTKSKQSKALASINSRRSNKNIDKDDNNSEESKCSERKITKSILKNRHMTTKDMKMQVFDSKLPGLNNGRDQDALRTAMQSATNLETKNKTPYPTISNLPEGSHPKVTKDKPQSQHRLTSMEISKKQPQRELKPVKVTAKKSGIPPKKPKRGLSIVDNHPDFIMESLNQDPWAPKSLTHFGPNGSRRGVSPLEIQARVDTFRRTIAEVKESDKNTPGGVHFESSAGRESGTIDRSSMKTLSRKKANLRRSLVESEVMDEYFDQKNHKQDQANARERIGKILSQLKLELENQADPNYGEKMKSLGTFGSGQEFDNSYPTTEETPPKLSKNEILKNRINLDLKKSKNLRQKFLLAKKKNIPVHEFALSQEANHSYIQKSNSIISKLLKKNFLDQTFAAGKNNQSYWVSDSSASDTESKLIPKKTKIATKKIRGEVGTKEHSHGLEIDHSYGKRWKSCLPKVCVFFLPSQEFVSWGGLYLMSFFRNALLANFKKLQFCLILTVAGQIWKTLQITAVICRILQIPRGSANSKAKLHCKKFAKVFCQKNLLSRWVGAQFSGPPLFPPK